MPSPAGGAAGAAQGTDAGHPGGGFALPSGGLGGEKAEGGSARIQVDPAFTAHQKAPAAGPPPPPSLLPSLLP